MTIKISVEKFNQVLWPYTVELMVWFGGFCMANGMGFPA